MDNLLIKLAIFSQIQHYFVINFNCLFLFDVANLISFNCGRGSQIERSAVGRSLSLMKSSYLSWPFSGYIRISVLAGVGMSCEDVIFLRGVFTT